MKLFCKMCGSSLPAGSGKRQTCGDNCRKAYSRRTEFVQSKFEGVLSGLQDLRRMVKKHSDLAPDINDKLRYLQNEIRDILALRDPEEQSRRQMLNDRANRRP